jgi:hypothetical protein
MTKLKIVFSPFIVTKSLILFRQKNGQNAFKPPKFNTTNQVVCVCATGICRNCSKKKKKKVLEDARMLCGHDFVA